MNDKYSLFETHPGNYRYVCRYRNYYWWCKTQTPLLELTASFKVELRYRIL